MYNRQVSVRLHLKAATTSGQGLVHQNPWQIAAALHTAWLGLPAKHHPMQGSWSDLVR